MNANVLLALQVLGASVLAPAIAAWGAATGLRRVLSAEVRERWEASIAIALGYVAGYLCNPSLTEVRPRLNWHWTLYLVPVAGVIGPLCVVPKIPQAIRWLLAAATLFACAAFLTPTWKSLWPPRPVCIPLLAGYLMMLAASTQSLASRVPTGLFLAAMSITFLAIAMIIASAVSLLNGQVALVAFGAGLGYTLYAWRRKDATRPLGISLVYAVLAGGWAFFGTVQPKIPEWGLLLAPLAPAALWLESAKPLGAMKPKPRALVLGALVLLILALSVAIVEAN